MSNVARPAWTPDKKAVAYSWPSTLGAAAPAETLFARMDVAVEPAVEGLELAVELTAAGGLVARAVNKSGRTLRLDKFVFRPTRGGGFLAVPSSRLRLFREGWTMASATGTVRLGESDFRLDPGYRPFAVSSPNDYHDDAPNRFSAEYVAVLNDQQSGVSALVGFISSADQVTRIAVSLDGEGVSSFEAIAYCDGVELAAGEELVSEELVVLSGRDGYGLLEEFADLWGKRMQALTWGHTPTGWCSWYYYFDKITERDMLENVAWLDSHKAEFPLEYIQMDDGYQSALGDWLVCDQAKFPNGLEFLAKKIRGLGFKPGLWLAPFMVEERAELFKSHPEWMVKDKKGETVWVSTWRGSRVAALDCTVPAATDWLTETFATLVRWGFEYVKLDFLMYECGAMALGGVYADPKATRAQALRRGLQAIRKGMGDKFILGCTTPLGPEVGLVNGARIGTDITPYWQNCEGEPYKEAPCVRNVCRNVINRSYMSGRLWINDPDTHIARDDNNKLTEDEVILWTSALWLVGGMLLLSDRFSSLSPERAKLSKMLLRDLDRFEAARPLDFFEREFPAIWLARSKAKPGERALGVFNFENEARVIKVDLAGGEATATELWSDESLGKVSGAFEVELRPHSCKVFVLKA